MTANTCCWYVLKKRCPENVPSSHGELMLSDFALLQCRSFLIQKVDIMKARGAGEAVDSNFVIGGKQLYSGGHAESIGPRPSMEDACVIIGEFAGPNTQYYGLYDGHGGSEVSLYCANTMHRTITRIMKENQNMEAVITEAIAEVNAHCSNKWPFVGTTAAMTLMFGDEMWFANVGDSRVILIENGKATRMTYDHKTSDPAERAGVIERGGHIINERVNGILMLARAIGDGGLGEAVGCLPHITKAVRKDGMYMILACDGVWDVMKDQEAADMVLAIGNCLEAAKAIKDEALSRGSTDNVSCVVVNLTPKERLTS